VYRAGEETAKPLHAPSPAPELGPLWLTALVTLMLLAVGLRIGFAVDPQRPQEPDSIGYARIAKNLYRTGSFEEGGVRTHTQEPSNYSPGLPLFVSGLYFVTGGVHLELARIVLALIGSLAVLFAFLIGSRLGGPWAGLVAGLVVCFYPALLQYQGMLMTEPLATTLLGAALLAFLWAGDGRGVWGWALPGLLLGLLALVRPEYLLFGLLAVPLVLLRGWRASGGWAQGALAALLASLAFLLPIVPWTVRNAIVLDRFVPISTGGGKALYVGTYLPADGDGPRLRDQLLREHPALAAQVQRLALSVRLDTLLAVLAAREHPGLDTDDALARMGRANIDRFASDDPNGFGEMLARKAYRAWREGPRSIMHSTFWKAFQKVLGLFGLLGLGVLAFRRRWEALPLALLVIATTATGALLIASPRRVLVILPAVAALAGAGVAWLGERVRTLWA
jgi:4-amino-4-deoxy-L-arabinose transferase-like glycosyltransferase